MEGTMRTTAKHDESYAPRKLTQDERLMVACVVVGAAGLSGGRLGRVCEPCC